MTHDIPAPKRVTKRLRFEVFRRDGFRCRYCGASADESGGGLAIDHVVPVALGGQNVPANLVTACVDCNSGKTSSSPDEHHVARVAEDAMRWAEAMRQVAARRQAELRQSAEEVDDFADDWNAATRGAQVSADWRESVERFLSMGLDRADLAHFADLAAARSGSGWTTSTTDCWRYFCGCCWREMERRQQLAAQLVADAEAVGEPDAFTPSLEQPPRTEGLPDLEDMMYDLGLQLRFLGVGRAALVTFVDHARRFGVHNAAGLIEGFDRAPEPEDDHVASISEASVA